MRTHTQTYLQPLKWLLLQLVHVKQVSHHFLPTSSSLRKAALERSCMEAASAEPCPQRGLWIQQEKFETAGPRAPGRRASPEAVGQTHREPLCRLHARLSLGRQPALPLGFIPNLSLGQGAHVLLYEVALTEVPGQGHP